MPLRDHFRSPVNDTHSWDEVHGGWPMEIVRDLIKILPAGFRAAPNVHLGSFEVDVRAYDLDTRDPGTAPDVGGAGPATQVALAPTFTVDADFVFVTVRHLGVDGDRWDGAGGGVVPFVGSDIDFHVQATVQRLPRRTGVHRWAEVIAQGHGLALGG